MHRPIVAMHPCYHQPMFASVEVERPMRSSAFAGRPGAFEPRLATGSPSAVTVRSAHRIARLRRTAMRVVLSVLVVANAALLGAVLGLLYVR